MLDAITINHSDHTIRPTHDRADEFFGVAALTNGTAAECRRALITPDGYSWRQSDGRIPTSLRYVYR